MRENVSDNVKETLNEFRKLGKIKELYFASIILNHLYNGLINDGNFLDSDEAYDNEKDVLEDFNIGLENDKELPTRMLLLASNMEDVIINSNGKDIEPYIKDIDSLKPILSKFYKLNYKDKIDFLSEIIYDISLIKETKILDFDFNELINELLSYRKETFGSEKIMMEVY